MRREAAYTALSEFAVARRRAAARSAAAAAQAGAGGGAMLQELPEFMLPFLLQARCICDVALPKPWLPGSACHRYR